MSCGNARTRHPNNTVYPFVRPVGPDSDRSESCCKCIRQRVNQQYPLASPGSDGDREAWIIARVSYPEENTGTE